MILAWDNYIYSSQQIFFMGIFEKLFGWLFKKRPKHISLSIADVGKFVEKERSKSKVLKTEVPKIFAEIRLHIDEIKLLLKELEEKDIDVENERFKKVAQSSKKNFSKRISQLIQKLEPPQAINAKSLRNYCFLALDEIEQGVFASRKNIAYATTAMPESMRSIGKNLEAISKLLENLSMLIDENKVVFSEEIENALNELQSTNEKIKSAEERLVALNEKKASAEEMLENARKRLSELSSSEEAKKAQELEMQKELLAKEKEQIMGKAISELSALKRPIKKFEKACKIGAYKLGYEQSSTLEKMALQPELLLKSDPKAKGIKEILAEMKNAIEKNAIEMNEKEKKQTLAQIDALLAKDFFNEIFWPINELDAKINRIEKELKSIEVSKKLHEAKLEVSRFERELKDASLEHKRCSEEIEDLRKELSALAKKLSMMLSEALSKEVVIS